MRINSLGINLNESYSNNKCKTCGYDLYSLVWSKDSMGGMMVCNNDFCVLKNQPQKFIEYRKRVLVGA